MTRSRASPDRPPAAASMSDSCVEGKRSRAPPIAVSGSIRPDPNTSNLPIIGSDYLRGTSRAGHHGGLQDHLYVLLIPPRRRVPERLVHVALTGEEFARGDGPVEGHPGDRHH